MRRVCSHAYRALCRSGNDALAKAGWDLSSGVCSHQLAPSQLLQVTTVQCRYRHDSAGGQVPELEQQARKLQESVAQRAMQDPMSALMTAAGVPLGISLRVGADHQSASSSNHQSHQEGLSQQQVDPAGTQQEPPPVQKGDIQENLQELLEAKASSDAWGTTSESARSIAQRIADSNAAAAASGEALAPGGALEDAEEQEEELSAAGLRYLNEQALAEDVQQMEEIYQLLAQVPYLDDNSIQERELRGVIAVALLGTLEEVGWQLRPALRALWAGERDLAVLTGQQQQPEAGAAATAADEGTAGDSEGLGVAGEQLPYVDPDSREYVALESILYHVQQLEAEYGPPHAQGVEAAIAAVSNSGPPRDSSWFEQQQRKEQEQQQQQQQLKAKQQQEGKGQ